MISFNNLNKYFKKLQLDTDIFRIQNEDACCGTEYMNRSKSTVTLLTPRQSHHDHGETPIRSILQLREHKFRFQIVFRFDDQVPCPVIIFPQLSLFVL